MLSSMGLVAVHRTRHLLSLSPLISRCSVHATHHLIRVVFSYAFSLLLHVSAQS